MQPGSTDDAVTDQPPDGSTGTAAGPPGTSGGAVDAAIEVPDADVIRRVADALGATETDAGAPAPAITVQTDEGGPLLPRRGN